MLKVIFRILYYYIRVTKALYNFNAILYFMFCLLQIHVICALAFNLFFIACITLIRVSLTFRSNLFAFNVKLFRF